LRSQSQLRVRPRHVAAGALAACTTLTVTAAAVAHAGGSTATGGAAKPVAVAGPLPTPTIALKDRHLRYGQHVVARGRADAPSVELQYRPAGHRWRSVRQAEVRSHGRYTLDALVRSSGGVRVVAAAVDDGTAGAGAGVGGVDAGSAAGASAAVGVGDVAGLHGVGGIGEAVVASHTEHVAVAAHLIVKRRSHTTATGQAVRLKGVLLPRGRGHRVEVEGRTGGRWHVLSHARTRGNGHFSARVVASSVGSVPLRVHADSTRANDTARAAAGSIEGLRPSIASWYGDYGGPLACGGTLGFGTLGVANKSLPCGTLVTIRYGGHQVRVPVVDRGPYVAGREWDLTGATARALGFGGVGTVWVDR
jgi:hypothetical protein